MNARQKQLINSAVGLLENEFLNNPNEEPITLEGAVNYCYEGLVMEVNECGESPDIYFQGKDAIIREITTSIKANKYIKLKKAIDPVALDNSVSECYEKLTGFGEFVKSLNGEKNENQ